MIRSHRKRNRPHHVNRPKKRKAQKRAEIDTLVRNYPDIPVQTLKAIYKSCDFDLETVNSILSPQPVVQPPPPPSQPVEMPPAVVEGLTVTPGGDEAIEVFLADMFPDLDPEVIADVLSQTKGDLSAATTKLLQIEDDDFPIILSSEDLVETPGGPDSDQLQEYQTVMAIGAEFPHIDKVFIREIYQACGNDKEVTRQTLLEQAGVGPVPAQAISQEEVKFSVAAPQPHVGHQGHLGRGRFQRHNEREYDQMVEAMHEDQRARDAYYQLASQALARGDRAQANRLRELGKQHMQQYRANIGAMSREIFNLRNQGYDLRRRIDLHSLHVKQALEIAAEVLEAARAARQRGESGMDIVNGLAKVEIVTGRGNHSAQHRSKLKPAVRQLLTRKGIQFAEGGAHFDAFV